MEHTCLVCGTKSFEKIYNDTLLKCNGCSFVTANLNMSEESLKAIYTENYFKGEEYADYLRDKDVLQKNFSKRIDFALSKFGSSKINNVLEIGAAYGFFAEALTKRLNGINFIGLDIAEDAIKYGQTELKQNLKAVDYLKFPSPEKKYSDVFMWDVIEHLPTPELVIAKAAAETQSGGRIYITTGDIDTFIPKMQKEKWRMIHPPSHLHYFSKKTISKLLEKNGYEVLHVKYPAVYRSMKLVFYALFLLNKKPSKFFTKIYNLIPEKWYFPFNSFDIMFVVAQKK